MNKIATTVANPLDRAKTYLDAGDFARAAAVPGGGWAAAAALGMLGETDRAIPALNQEKDPDARFFLAAAHFIEGNDEGARSVLNTLVSRPAKHLARMIAKPKIKVLAQLPWSRQGVQTSFTGIAADTKFEVINYTFHPEDHQNRPYASIHEWYDRADPPDFFLVQMLEWHQVPIDVIQAPFPTFAHTSDTDLHIQAIRGWLKAFDCLLVLDQTEFDSVSSVVGNRPVATAPLCFGWSNSRPAGRISSSTRAKDFDVFVSGTMLHHYHPDKAKLVCDLIAESSDLRVAIIDGFLSEERYFDLLSRSLATVCYYRKPGGMVTRGIDALCMGSAALVPEESVLRLYDAKYQALQYYRSDFSNFRESVRKTVFEARNGGTGGARYYRDLFDGNRTASRYFREIAVLSCLMPRGFPRALDSIADHRRPVMHMGWLPDVGPCAQLRAANREVWRKKISEAKRGDETAPKQSRYWNLLAREHGLQYAQQSLPEGRQGQPGDLRFALRTLKHAVARNPDDLVSHFNLIRLTVYFGDRMAKQAAVALAQEVMKREASDWRLGVDDDVWPYDFGREHFNYRSYFDDLMIALDGRDQAAQSAALERCKRRVLAAISHIAAITSDDAALFKVAYALDPDFPPFVREAAAKLLVSASLEEVEQGVRLCSSLIESSYLAVQAFELLREAHRFALPHARAVIRAAVVKYDGTRGAWNRNFGYLGLHGERLHSTYYDKLSTLRPRELPGDYRLANAKLISIMVMDLESNDGDFVDRVRDFSRQVEWDCEVVIVRPFAFYNSTHYQGLRVISSEDFDLLPSSGKVMNKAITEAINDIVLIVPAFPEDSAELVRMVREYVANVRRMMAKGHQSLSLPSAVLQSRDAGPSAIAAYSVTKESWRRVSGADANALISAIFDPFDLLRKIAVSGLPIETSGVDIPFAIPSKRQFVDGSMRRVVEVIQPNLLVPRPRSTGDGTTEFLDGEGKRDLCVNQTPLPYLPVAAATSTPVLENIPSSSALEIAPVAPLPVPHENVPWTMARVRRVFTRIAEERRMGYSYDQILRPRVKRHWDTLNGRKIEG